MDKEKLLSFDDSKCIEILLNNNVLAFPTETVYGLGVIYDSKIAFDNLVSLKRRAPDKPFTLMISSKDEFERFAYIDQKTRRVIDKFLPGEITLLLKSKDNYPWVNLNSDIIGIRMSSSVKVCELIKRIGKPLLVTSANISGLEPMNTAEDVYETFKEELKGIVKEESLSSNKPSTIVLIKDNEIKLIRSGSIPFDEIKNTWEGNL